MTHIYSQTEAGEPDAHLNSHNPADPFAVIRLGGGWYLTSKDARWCRRAAATWTHAAELLERAIEEQRPQGETGTGALAAMRGSGGACSPSPARTEPGQGLA